MRVFKYVILSVFIITFIILITKPKGIEIIESNELVRYPFLQTENFSNIKFSWATKSKGEGKVIVKKTNGKRLDTCLAEVIYNPSLKNYQYLAKAVNLAENEQYLYDILEDNVILANNIPFKTLSNSSHFGFVVIGDTGLESETITLMRDQIMSRDSKNDLKHPFDFSIGVGDLAYSSGNDFEFETAFFSQFSGQSDNRLENSMISSRPFFPVLGNHEYRTENADGFRRAFNVPAPAEYEGYKFHPSDQGRFYSFDNGNAHFVILDTEAWGENQVRGEEMLVWLKKDLEANRKQWNFVFYHRSPLSFGYHGYNTGEDWGEMDGNRIIRSRLMTICQNNGVNVAFYGHDHMYQRSVPLRINNDEDGSILRKPDLSIDSANGIVYVGTGWGKPSDEEPMRTPIAKPGSPIWEHQRKVTGIGFDWLARYDHDNNGILEANEYAMVDGEAKYNPWLTSRRGHVYVEINGNILTGYAFTIEGQIADKWVIKL